MNNLADKKHFNRYLVTSALPYANGPLHIGQIAGAYITADIYTRYLRLKGEDVLFVCGSDEHGAAITLRAKKDKTTPKEIVDKYHSLIKSTFEDFGIKFDIYHRTSSELHHETAAAFFTTLNDKSKFEQKRYNSIMMKNTINFLPTATSLVPVPTARTKMLTEINVKVVVLP